MEYKAYKMTFLNGLHVGKILLEESEYSLHADTLFSALCQEAMKMGEDCLERLCRYIKTGQLLVSDAFPCIGERYYLPKPLIRIETEKQGDSKIKKAYKQLNYIPADLLGEYLSGQMDVRKEQLAFKQLGIGYSKTSVSVFEEEETKPYRVGIYQFHKGNGLYVIVGYESSDCLSFFEMLLYSLSYTGIGGKRSAGLGRFQLQEMEIYSDIRQRLQVEGKRYMTLSVSLPQKHELEVILEGASYQMLKRSGFVVSNAYAEEFRRKRDLYVLNAGSCVEKKYQGDVYDVSSGGRHAVYRYAKPMFLEVSI